MSTFGELKENVSLELGLSETASEDEDNLVGRRLNQAVRRVLLETHLYVISGSITLTASDNEYELNDALSTDPLAVLDIKNSDGYSLDRVSVEEIHDLRRASGGTSTGTTMYKYALDGANLLLLYPTPGSNPGSLTAYYVPKPTEMSAAGNDPSATTYGGIPSEFHDALEYYALMRMASYDDDASSQMGMKYEQDFEKELVRIRKWVRNRGGRKLGRARVGLGRAKHVPSDPSATAYWG